MIAERSYASKTIGIVVPTLGKRLEYLIENLQSLNASKENIFVCVVRPRTCSSLDSTIAHLADLIVDDPKNGLSGAINLGISSLPQEIKYVNWLGDDDFIVSSGLTNAFNFLETNKNLNLVFGNCRYVDSIGVTRFTHKPRIPRILLTRFGPNQISQPAALFRRTTFDQLGGLDERLELAMDLDLWLRFFKIKKSYKYIDEIIANYRWHSESLSAANETRARFESSQVRRRYLNFTTKPIELFVNWFSNFYISLFGAKLDNIFNRSTFPN